MCELASFLLVCVVNWLGSLQFYELWDFGARVCKLSPPSSEASGATFLCN